MNQRASPGVASRYKSSVHQATAVAQEPATLDPTQVPSARGQVPAREAQVPSSLQWVPGSVPGTGKLVAASSQVDFSKAERKLLARVDETSLAKEPRAALVALCSKYHVQASGVKLELAKALISKVFVSKTDLRASDSTLIPP